MKRHEIQKEFQRCFTVATWVLSMSVMALTPGLLISSQARAAIRAVAMEGETAPGFPAGATFVDFAAEYISINNSGQTAFTAKVISGSTQYRSLWRDEAGVLTLMHQSGELPPGLSGDVAFQVFRPPNMNDSGMIAFVAQLEGNDVQYPVNDQGVWKGVPGAVSLVARAGDAAPGSFGDTFGNAFGYWVLLSNSGQIAFHNNLNGGGATTNASLWQETASGLTLVAKQNDEVPGIPNTAYYITGDRIYLNMNGQLLFNPSILCIPGSGKCLDWNDYYTGAGLMQVAANSTITTKYKSWTSAPGVPGGKFGYLIGKSPYDFNASGRMVFAAVLEYSESISPSNDWGLWSDASGNLSLVAREGSHAPGTPAGAVFDGRFLRSVLNDTGQVAFIDLLKQGSGNVDASNDTGLWFGNADSLTLLAREGDQAPEFPDGWLFGGFSIHAINNRGQICFHAWVSSGSETYRGIWMYDPSGGLKLVVREGEALTLTSGETVTFQQDSISVGYDNMFFGSNGEPRFFNDQGEIAFRATVLPGYREGFFIASALYAATYHVSGDGYCGGKDNCYTTIQAAVKASADGDTILVHHGDYYETIVLDEAKSLNLLCGRGDDFGPTAQSSTAHGLEIQRGSLTVEGLHLVGE